MNVPCPDCFTGTLRGDVVPRGREEILYGLPTYVAGPEPGIRPLGTVVIIPDAFGWRLLNTRALADVYAQRVPCIVYVPDFMNDHSPPQKFMILSEAKPPANSSLLRRVFSGLWTTIRVLPLLLSFAIHNRPSKVKPRIQSFIRSVRGTTISPAQSSPTPLAVAGFCWGGPYTVRLTHDIPENKVLFNPGGIPGVSKGVEVHVIDCAFTAHPSLLEVPGDIEKVVWPLSIADGDNDEWLGRKKWEQVVKTLESKNRYWRERSQQTEGGPIEDLHQAKVYPGAKHGFAVRGDRDDPMQRERGWRSEDQAVRWFRRHFGEQAHGQGAASISVRSRVTSPATSPGIGSGPLPTPSPSLVREGSGGTQKTLGSQAAKGAGTIGA